MSENLAPGLYLTATPIGNLRDITLRALDVLSGADLVLAEDTRVTAKLLAAHNIVARMERYDDHAAPRVRPRVLSALADGARIALVSDAGTPLISDPGYRLVSEAIDQGVNVVSVPGPSSVLTALTVSGLPTDRFVFVGFPPPRAAARRRLLEEVAAIPATLVFFEGGSRLAASLADMAEILGPRPAAVARELTKLHETVVRGTLDELARDRRTDAPKGEMVVVVGAGREAPAGPEEADAALSEALTRQGPAEAAAEVAKALGLPRRRLYARAVALKRR
jgi:16S rRNA (cytidine1402-2'-O)-methyltransferase